VLNKKRLIYIESRRLVRCTPDSKTRVQGKRKESQKEWGGEKRERIFLRWVCRRLKLKGKAEKRGETRNGKFGLEKKTRTGGQEGRGPKLENGRLSVLRKGGWSPKKTKPPVTEML